MIVKLLCWLRLHDWVRQPFMRQSCTRCYRGRWENGRQPCQVHQCCYIVKGKHKPGKLPKGWVA